MIHKFKGTYKNAIIYATINPLKATALKEYHYEIIKFDMYGNKKINNAANFINEGKNINLDLKRISSYSNKKIK